MRKLFAVLLLIPALSYAANTATTAPTNSEKDSGNNVPPPTAVIVFDRDCNAGGMAGGLHLHSVDVASGVGSIQTITYDNASSGVAATVSWVKVVDTSVLDNIDVTCARKLP